ncbi:F-box only protein 16 isoform X2 [Melanotaenia boesemani]|nr:F-box only protein 16 isoform X2 [Melanotaenia boesemani]
MPLAPKLSASCAKLQTKRSTWTPLNHPLANSKVFEERRSLLAKWFARWSDSQRKAVLQDFVLNCSVEQLRFLSLSVAKQLPLQAGDFTCLLPRALCLYLFSFLDPRSLCRCAQVSWHWRSIVELDQLWMPKCLRFGWCISFSPSPFEQGVWKRLYIQTVQELRLSMQQTRLQLMVPDASAVISVHDKPPEPTSISKEHLASTSQPRGASSGFESKKEKRAAAPPPWRDSDRRPKDTIRFNYLDNLDPIEQAMKMQTRSRSSTCWSRTSKMDDSKRKPASEATYKLRKVKSLMFLSSNSNDRSHSPPPYQHHHPHLQAQSRPSWASHFQGYPITKETATTLLGQAGWDAGVRPRPVRTSVPRLSAAALRASQRSLRSAASTPLFEVWS